MRNLIIIGSGPAAYTAALYSGRANLKPLVLEGDPFRKMPDGSTLLPGGQLMITTEVENYPGFPKGIKGPELMKLFREQAARFDVEMAQESVTEVDFRKRPFRVTTPKRTEEARAVIVATGAAAKWLGLEAERKLMNHGVSACATCDGALPIFRNQPLVVVGGGDTAMEEATFLTKFASKVTIIHRREQFRASKIMLERARKNPKIELLVPAVVTDILDPTKGRVEAVRIRHPETGEERTLETKGYFAAIGHEPLTAVFQGQLELDAKGYIVPKLRSMTSVEGVFAAGDVMDAVYRQAITAAGMGCAAAIDAERWLEAQGGH